MGLALEHDIPSATTFARMWGRIDPEAFETCFAERTGQVHKKIIGEVDKGHGRIEHRTYYLATDLSGLATANEWTGLKANGIVRSCVTIGETETTETCYAITSLTDIDTFATAMRRHWSIENGLHYCLDASFREDHSCIRKITPRETWLLSSIVRIKAASDANGNLAGAAEENRRL